MRIFTSRTLNGETHRKISMKRNRAIGLVLVGLLSILVGYNSERLIIPKEDSSVKQNSVQRKSTQTACQVLYVVDGDTIDVSINDKSERVRLIGINTPEIVYPNKKV